MHRSNTVKCMAVLHTSVQIHMFLKTVIDSCTDIQEKSRVIVVGTEMVKYPVNGTHWKWYTTDTWSEGEESVINVLYMQCGLKNNMKMMNRWTG